VPYYISDQNLDCSGWAVEKEDGEVIGCHDTKQSAVDQMVAVSLAENMEPGGERDVEVTETREVNLTPPALLSALQHVEDFSGLRKVTQVTACYQRQFAKQGQWPRAT
jgi:hypothetical protein